MRSKTILTDGEIYHALGLYYQYCENIYTIQCNLYQINNGLFHRIITKTTKIPISLETKYPEYPKRSLERKTELYELNFLTSNYTTKLQSSRQYGTGWKQKYRSMGQDTITRDKPNHYGHLIKDKRGKNLQWRKDKSLQ